MKKFATITGTVALFAATLLPAMASTGNNCGNGTTGPYSNNYCTINNTSRVTVNNVNDAQIKNEVKAESNTGGNSASKNTLGGSILTGNATLNTTVSTVANVNTTTIHGGPAGSSNFGENQITGPDSTNGVDINNDHRFFVENSNTASVKNDVETEANTGENDADKNTGPGSVRTGDAWLRTLVANHVNDNATHIVVGETDGHGDGNEGANNTTGPYSDNWVTIRNLADVAVRNINDMQVLNKVDADANTGENSASENTLGGDVNTGDANAEVGVETEGNINTTTIQLALGGFTNDASNGVTGPDSDNNTLLNNEENITVDNWNNKCESHNADRLEYNIFSRHRGWWNEDGEGCDVENLGVVNDVEVESNTGENDADMNTGGSVTSTGWADLVKEVMTRLNDTFTLIN